MNPLKEQNRALGVSLKSAIGTEDYAGKRA